MSSNFTTLEATYRIVTPMFCGGADPAEPELRLSSIKGALRFWWRTLQWGKITSSAELLEAESRLFGSSDQKIGRSRVQIRLVDSDRVEKIDKDKRLENGTLSGVYYLGYGLMEAFGAKAGKLNRGALSGGEFRVGLRCGPALSSEETASVKAALILLGTVGGIGSRVRRGFGSLTLTSLSQDGETIDLPIDIEARLKSSLPSLSPRMPEWTAWASMSRVVLVGSAASENALHLLNRLGKEMMYYRSWGHNGKVLGRDSERNFKEDHDLSKIPDRKAHPKRVVFGLPHNYGKGSGLSVVPDGKEFDRRASPLFFHVHQPDSRTPCKAVLTYLPSKFLPDGTEIAAFGDSVELDRSPGFWKPINEYLDRLQRKAKKDPVEHFQAKELKIGQ